MKRAQVALHDALENLSQASEVIERWEGYRFEEYSVEFACSYIERVERLLRELIDNELDRGSRADD